MKKRVVVVGGAGGIGSAIVRKFVETGYEVAIGDTDLEAALRLTVELGEAARFVPVDVLDRGSIATFAAELAKTGFAIDHLISLAGGSLEGEYKGLKVLTPDRIDAAISLNLTSHLHLTTALLPVFGTEDGQDRSITFVSSINAIKDYGLPAYSAAKAGLLGLVYPLAAELGPRQIRVNALLPGTVLTDRTLKLPRRLDETIKNGTALDRLSTPDEIAGVAYAIAALMTCVTGQQIVADCGQSIKGYPLFPSDHSRESESSES